MIKTKLLLMAAVGLTMTAHAELGWTLAQCKAKYGKPITGPITVRGARIEYQFTTKEFPVTDVILLKNAPNVAWSKGEQNLDNDTVYSCTEGGYFPKYESNENGLDGL
jgi:hypothetical protein